jgi:hypothetical protein
MAELTFPGVTYSRRSLDLARYTADPIDEVIARAVEGAAQSDLAIWQALGERLGGDDCYALLAFADRRAAAALRARDPQHAGQAVHALALVTRDKIDWRDISVDFPLYAVRESGGDLESAIDFAIARSEPGTRDAFKARAGSAKRVSLKDCAYIEVQSKYGVGFMETRAEPTPRCADLPAMAVAIADQIDEAGRYEVESLCLSALPRMWLGLNPREGVHVPGFGGVVVSADLRGSARWSHRLLVFLSDHGDEATARGVADLVRGASDADRPRTALSDGSLVLTVIGGSSTARQNAIETPASLTTVRDDLARAAGLGRCAPLPAVPRRVTGTSASAPSSLPRRPP